MKTNLRRSLLQACLLAAALLALPAVVQAQFNYTTNNGTITITGYAGPGGDVTIPDTITGLPVMSIGYVAFSDCTSLTSITLPSSLTNIEVAAFQGCSSLTSITIPGKVISLSGYAFSQCTGLTNVTIADGVGSIGEDAFGGCGLSSVIFPNSVTSISGGAFGDCSGLTSAYFMGDAPSVSRSFYFGVVFQGDNDLTVYYLPGASGWDSSLAGAPAVFWNPQIHTSDANFGLHANQFEFNITGTPDIPVLIEASANLVSPVWFPLQALTLTNGLVHFSDSQWTNYPARFYRLRSP